MNIIRLAYLRWRAGFLAAQWEHAAQLSETYRYEAENIQKEMAKVNREIFLRQPAREITQ